MTTRAEFKTTLHDRMSHADSPAIDRLGKAIRALFAAIQAETSALSVPLRVEAIDGQCAAHLYALAGVLASELVVPADSQ